MMAAKSFVGMVRDNNEDNFQCSSDLDNATMQWKNNENCALSNKGALLVVADGMGGMNAGEVASEIAIETVKDCFRPENITADVLRTRYTIERFMNNVITEADNRIKATAKERPETKGMGTTMVMGWVNCDKLYVSWCGDSRAYVFNPSKGLKRLSKDHSLVQELVDSGKISKEDAFDYPDSNVITNCLSAVAQKAEPSVLAMPHKLEQDDIILLCSDGLCGLIRDSEIQSVITQNQNDMTACCDALIKAACEAGGHDNVTVALCKMLTVKDPENKSEPENNGRKTWINFGVGVVLALLIGLAVWYFFPSEKSNVATENKQQTEDTTKKKEQNPKETPSENDGTTKDHKKKYVSKSTCTDSVTAELTINKDNTNNLVIRVATFPPIVFNNFKYNTNSDTINGAYNFEHDNYRCWFKSSDFYAGVINGRMVIEKTEGNIFRDSVTLYNVPLKLPAQNNNNSNLNTGGGKIGDIKPPIVPPTTLGGSTGDDVNPIKDTTIDPITKSSADDLFN